MGDDDLGHWEPLSLAEVAHLLGGLSIPWWIAGGQAIDLFIGHQTRDHEDVDVGISRRDQLALQRHLAGWALYAAGGGRLTPWTPGEEVAPGINDIWCRPIPTAPWALQVMLDDGDNEQWVYRRDHAITRPLHETMLHDATGVPYLAPEVQLLFKSKGPRPKDEADLQAVLPYLSENQRQWLARALATTAPGHPWLADL